METLDRYKGYIIFVFNSFTFYPWDLFLMPIASFLYDFVHSIEVQQFMSTNDIDKLYGNNRFHKFQTKNSLESATRIGEAKIKKKDSCTSLMQLP